MDSAEEFGSREALLTPGWCNGRIRRGLPDREGLVRFIFEHTSGAVLEFEDQIGTGFASARTARDRERRTAGSRDDLRIFAEGLELDLNLSEVNPKVFGD